MTTMHLKDDLKPGEIVAALDRYIIGQDAAKRSVAIALRNRWRRRHVEPDLRDEIAPKNIILIGPTGVGKTEIARRLSQFTDSPFFKVEASKFTEVGYVGRDVESMIRDLVELTVNNFKIRARENVKKKAAQIAEERLLDLLLPKTPAPSRPAADGIPDDGSETVRTIATVTDETPPRDKTREKLRAMLRAGKMDERFVDFETTDKSMPMVEVFSSMGMEEVGFNFKDMLGGLLPKNTKQRKMKIREAREILIQEEAQNLVDMDQVVKDAVGKVEESGIIFLDEIDKIVANNRSSGPDVSREGVQRDLLPIVEGSTVMTKYGPVKSDHILFIASGAFHTVKPSDLIPELQGRFPIRVELNALSKNDFIRILTEPKNALLLQYMALLRTESVDLIFEDDAVAAIAAISENVNLTTENIGARRLHTVLERLLDDYLFNAPDNIENKVVVDGAYVEKKLADVQTDEDLTRYIL